MFEKIEIFIRKLYRIAGSYIYTWRIKENVNSNKNDLLATK